MYKIIFFIVFPLNLISCSGDIYEAFTPAQNERTTLNGHYRCYTTDSTHPVLIGQFDQENFSGIYSEEFWQSDNFSSPASGRISKDSLKFTGKYTFIDDEFSFYGLLEHKIHKYDTIISINNNYVSKNKTSLANRCALNFSFNLNDTAYWRKSFDYKDTVYLNHSKTQQPCDTLYWGPDTTQSIVQYDSLYHAPDSLSGTAKTPDAQENFKIRQFYFSSLFSMTGYWLTCNKLD